jgi:nitrogenase molybdenum-cofactor synthesis protein NifE
VQRCSTSTIDPTATSGGQVDQNNGGCAFRGAKLNLQPITDALHLVHGPIVCQGHSWQSRPTASSGSTLHRISFTTALSDLDVVLGAEKRLARSLDALAAKYDPPAIFVYSTCVPAMSGDDIRAVCKAATVRLKRPVLAVEAPGFSGGKLDGVQIAARVLIDDVIGTREPDCTTSTDVLLIAENNVAGEASAIAALLNRCGIRVLASIPGDGRFNAIAGAHRARASIVHCSQSVAGLGPDLMQRYGIPYAAVSFYGAANTSDALRRIAQLLIERGATAELAARVDAIVTDSELAMQRRLAPILPRLRNKRALLMTGGVKGWSLADTLLRLGMRLAAVSTQKTSAEDRCKLEAVVAGRCPLFDDIEQEAFETCLASGDIDLVLGGGCCRFTVQRLLVPWVEINHERHIALTGYDGSVALAEAMANALDSPVLAALRAEAQTARPA